MLGVVRLKSAEEGVHEARREWERKLNCAESVLRGACFAQDVPLADIAKKMATPFGGGIGRAEDLCGALSGGVLAIGACIGRLDPDEDKQRCYEAARELHRRFLETFGATSCRALNKSDFKSPEHRVRCGRLVDGSTRLTIEILRKK